MTNTVEQNVEKVADYLFAIERAGTPYDWWHEGDGRRRGTAPGWS